MDIKTIPGQAVISVKNSNDGKRQAPESRELKPKKPPATTETKAPKTEEEESTPEAADAAMRASQPMDSQTVVELLTHPVIPASTAKFPAPAKLLPPGATAKKLNRNA